MKRSLKFQIARNGNVKTDGSTGFAGGCAEATAEVEKLLGQVDESSRQLTQDYYVQNDPLTIAQSGN